MRRAVCPGSFDPVTLGHVDIFTRASRLFDEVIVGVFHNIRKTPLFSVEERVRFLEESTGHIPNLQVQAFDGLLTDYLHREKAGFLVRGIRSVTDLEYEMKQAQMIRHLSAEVETVFLLTDPRYAFLSSSGVRELINFHGEVKGLVPPCVELAIENLGKKP